MNFDDHSMEQETREIPGKVLFSRSEVLSEICNFRNTIINPPSAAEIDGWIAEGRRGRGWNE